MKKFLLILSTMVVFVIATFELSAQGFNPENLPALLGAGNAGTEFYLTFHPCWEESGSNNALKVYVSSAVTTKVTLTIEGFSISRTKTTIPNDVIEFNLTAQEGQMYSKGNGGLSIPPQPSQVWQKRAIHITSQDPIVVYGVTRYRYTSDGFLALPVHLLGKNYQVASYADPTTNTSQYLPSYTSIIAIYDNTKVTFTLGGTESSKALLPNNETLRFGQQKKETMFAGDVWLLAGIGAYNDLTGSTVNADKPVAVISGNFCAYVPTWNSACDFIIEQEIPTEYWANDVIVPTIIGRKFNPIIKVFAKEANTDIYRNGVKIGNILTAGGLAGTGYLEMRSDTLTPKLTKISGNKPINVVLYNPGQSEDGISSDPFQMQLIPQSLFYTDYIFNTPGVKGGMGFKQNYLCVIFKNIEAKVPNGLEYKLADTSIKDWIKIDTAIFVQDGDNYIGQATITLEQDGVYRLRHNEPIMGYAYGFADYDSYGFPIGAYLVSEQNKLDTTKPTITMLKNTTTEATGNISDLVSGIEGSVSSTFSSNLSLVTLLQSESQNVNFSFDKFIPGESPNIKWVVELIDFNKPGYAVILASDKAGNSKSIKVELTGNVEKTYASVSNLNKVTDVRINKEFSDSLEIKNTSSLKTYLIKEVYLSSSKNERKTGYKLNTELKDFELNSNESRNINYSFSNDTYGTILDTLLIEYEDNNIKIGTVLKLKVVKLQYSLSSVNFDSTLITKKATMSTALVNKSTLPITFSGFKPFTNSEFSFKNVNFPFVLDAQKTIYLEIVFEPTKSMLYTEDIVFETDADEITFLSITGIGYEKPISVSDNSNSLYNVKQFGNIIEINSTENISNFRIIDMKGAVLINKIQNNSFANIDISNLSFGVFVLEFTINEEKHFYKFSK